MRRQQDEPPARSHTGGYRSGDNHPEVEPRDAVLIAAITRCCDPGRALRVLDLGCGDGAFLERLRGEVSERWDYHGVDTTRTAVESGRKRRPYLGLETVDGTSLPAATASFDAVICRDFLERCAEPRAALAEAARVLLPGGWFFARIASSDRQAWVRTFDRAGLLLLDGSVAAGCGAEQPEGFVFGVRTAAGSAETSAIRRGFLDLHDLAARLPALLEPDMLRAIDLLAQTLEQGGKILACGNGGSAADAQHFVAELVGRMLLDRRALPAVSLCTDPSVVTAVGNDFGYEQIFARQVEALGQPGDALLAISTSGRSPNVLAALEAARGIGLRCLVLVGPSPGPELDSCDVTLAVPADATQRIQEGHIAILHALGEAIEVRLVAHDRQGARLAGREAPATRTLHQATTDN